MPSISHPRSEYISAVLVLLIAPEMIFAACICKMSNMSSKYLGQLSVLDYYCAKEGGQSFFLYNRSAAVLDPAQRKLIGCTHLANRASLQDWDNLFEIYLEVQNIHKLERARVRDALACTKDEWLLLRYVHNYYMCIN